MRILDDDFRICADCLDAWIGSDDPTPEVEASLQALQGLDAGSFLLRGDEEDDHEFSWSCCDLCRSFLGGSRHAMALATDKPENPPLPPSPPILIRILDPLQPPFVWEYFPHTGYLRREGRADTLGVWINAGLDYAGLHDHARNCYPKATLEEVRSC